MKIASIGFPLRISVRGLAFLVLFCVGVTGCSTVKSLVTSDKEKKELFRSRDQYVRLVDQDKAKGVKVQPNAHPVLLDEQQIRMALATLEFIMPGQDKSSPVFDKPELDVLEKYISTGLSQAASDEDLIFGVIGDYRAVYGLTKEQMYTAARVFYRDGKLNIIFGNVHGKYWANADRRLYPLAPGSRFTAAQHPWRILDQPDQEFYQGPEGVRTDWVVLDLASMEARAALGEKAASQAAGMQGGQPYYGAPKSVEERLMTLNELKNKKLITEEEYEKKRLDILKDL